MPGERRTLRSNKESASSTNGEKGRADPQNTSAKDKPVPARSASSKAKPAATKKATNSSKDTTNDKSKTNGAGPVENGINGVEDVEMAEDAGNGRPHKDGEDEMTVVVPPPNSSKLSGDPGKDGEGDVVMDSDQKAEGDEQSEDITDPREKAMSGILFSSNYHHKH